MIPALIVVLSTIGLVISSYFTAVAYRWVEPDASWVPPICRLDEGTCARVVDTPRAKVFGLPNSILGQLWYVALIVAVLGGALDWPVVRTLFLAGAVGTVALGAYLTYSLLFLTRVNCRLCFTSHAINALLLVLLIFG